MLKIVFLSLWITQFFEITIKKVRKDRDIKFFTTERRRKYLLSEPNHHTTKFFTENSLAIEMKRNRDTCE